MPWPLLKAHAARHGKLALIQFDAHQDTWYDDGRRYLLCLANTDDYRSNIGFVEVLGLDAVFELEMVDARGVSLARETITLPAFYHRQINDVFYFLGVAPQDNVKVTVNLENPARLFIYASVVDNRSGDAVYIPDKELADQAESKIGPG